MAKKVIGKITNTSGEKEEIIFDDGNPSPIESSPSEHQLLIENIIKFVDSMKGKREMTREQAKIMFGYYNTYYNQIEQEYSCSLCCIRIFSKLEKIANQNR